MASIFLSYDREDEPRARPVAAVLERSGHPVWWDRRIRGGREFSAEIEAALEAADRIVVLWSARAVKSAWVRDEAAVGRDTGRLVPATLDGTRPPLGFRQFQTIDLSKTKWRGSSPQFEQLVEALDVAGATEESSLPGPRNETRPLSRPKLLSFFAVAVLAILVAAAIWLWPATASERPQIAVRPADQSQLSRQVVRDLVLKIPELPGADASAYDLLDPAQPSSKAQIILTVGAASGGRERRDLVLRASDGAILWSTSIDLPAAKSEHLAQQLAVQAQRALTCAADVLSYHRETITQDTFKLYLSGCTSFKNAFVASDDNSQQIKLYEQVIAQARHFEPAWSKLLITKVYNLDSAYDRGAARLKIIAQAEEAKKLGLDFGELYLARALTVYPTEFVEKFRIYEEGRERHPENAELHRAEAELSWSVGRMNDAVGLSARAVQLDPLSPANWQTLIMAHAYAGNTEAAYAQLRKAEQLWPGSPSIISARFGLAFRYGDPKEALALLEGPAPNPEAQTQLMLFLKARIDPTPANIERSIAEDRRLHDQYPEYFALIAQTLAQFGRKDELFDILINYEGGYWVGYEVAHIFRPAFRDFWREPRSMAVADKFGLLYFWKTSGNWPDFCSDPKLTYDCKKEAAKYRAQKFTVAPTKK